ncbi:TonB receptor [Phytophthora cinnamomi]|uniref:TonB receptor n=1 Tax=Phytophthora cinnamomi TaxID=4785 RepID=UPI003559E766|nr:TonB receptor [Phytophthora cinnamomi]
MSTKSGISFLLNPQSSDEAGLKVTAPTSPPPPTFQRLMAMAQSPDAEATSSLLLLGSSIAPLEKKNANKKTVVPALSLAALCEASSGSSYSTSGASSGDSDDDEAEEQQTVVKTTELVEKDDDPGQCVGEAALEARTHIGAAPKDTR